MDNKILVKVKADITDLNQKLDSAGKNLDKWSKDTMGGFTSLAKGIGAATLRFAAMTAPITATGAAIFAMMQKTANTGEELHSMSQKTGLTVEELYSLKQVAEFSDVSLGDLDLRLKDLARNLFEARNKAGEARDMFKALGIDTSKSLYQVLMDLAKRFAEMEDGEGKLAIVTQLFGRNAQDIIPVLNDLASGAHKVAGSFSEKAAKAASEFNNNIIELKQNLMGLVNSIGNVLIPKVNELFDIFSKSQADKIVDSYKNLNTEIANLGIRIAQIQGQGDTSGLEKQLLSLVDKSLNPIKNLNEQIAETEKRIKGLEGFGDTSGLQSKLSSLVEARKELIALQFQESTTKTTDPLIITDEDRKKYVDNEQNMAKLVDDAGQKIIDSLNKRAAAYKKLQEQQQSAREAEIQLQLKEIDLAEQEFRISKSGAVEERLRLYDELKRIQTEYIAGLDKVNDPASWYAQINAINDTREALVQLNLQLKEQTGTFTEGFSYGFQKFQHDAKTSFQYGQQAAEDTANAIGQTFENISFDAMQGKLQTLGDYFRSFITSMQKSVSQIFGQLAIKGIMMGVGAAFGAPTAAAGGPIMVHSGGYIPRFHAGGLSSDEVPAILQRGEYVINRRAVDAVGKSTLDNINTGRGAGRASNNYFIIDPEAAEAYSKMSERQLEARITKLMKDNRLKPIRR